MIGNGLVITKVTSGRKPTPRLVQFPLPRRQEEVWLGPRNELGILRSKQCPQKKARLRGPLAWLGSSTYLRVSTVTFWMRPGKVSRPL